MGIETYCPFALYSITAKKPITLSFVAAHSNCHSWFVTSNVSVCLFPFPAHSFMVRHLGVSSSLWSSLTSGVADCAADVSSFSNELLVEKTLLVMLWIHSSFSRMTVSASVAALLVILNSFHLLSSRTTTNPPGLTGCSFENIGLTM